MPGLVFTSLSTSHLGFKPGEVNHRRHLRLGKGARRELMSVGWFGLMHASLLPFQQ